ncbi:MAG: diadenylate cyclase CdaA [Muribaculaceae bacterium]|nr:diadenylate cyclase CdaA [Muribaculaceae bacterium]MBQ2490099.1 diadenylate cyclase CdaA [Muribaculaceae bacterium]MBQ3961791.1 diadenylate cyclase CdaA [Muribaculaceae bacterium]MBQ4007328.1 diadenylate cyclase CdaA [Muribaculaceae bacterium]MBQ5466431.1 diadenylate cyclase CdaA [Muribaculaceae bacterium]
MEQILGLIGIKDIVDILLVATLLFYLYRTMKDSGSLNIFMGVLSFVITWVVLYKILDMQLIGTLMDKFIDIGLFILVILFQDQIRRFLMEIGSRKGLKFITKLWHKNDPKGKKQQWVMPVVYACMSMSKSKTGALIVVRQQMPLDDYEKTGDVIDANLNNRLIENIFFKNSPLHDGALIIDGNKMKAAGCILPVSHDTDLPRYLGLRHRSALGIAQATDAIAIVVSEETGSISYAHRGELHLKLNSTELEQALSELSTNN